MNSIVRPTLVVFFLLSMITGALYPAVVTGLAQTIFPEQANGSLVFMNGQIIGSELIGQTFTDPAYFWGRPSAAIFNGGASSGSNLGPNNPDLIAAVEERAAKLQAADPANQELIPADLVTSSGSGLDPHISIAAAYYQIPRVAKARSMPESTVRDLVDASTEARQLGLFGEPRLNVLRLNLALDGVQ
jgi:K+-transporting ATPase ATPase C chain